MTLSYIQSALSSDFRIDIEPHCQYVKELEVAPEAIFNFATAAEITKMNSQPWEQSLHVSVFDPQNASQDWNTDGMFHTQSHDATFGVTTMTSKVKDSPSIASIGSFSDYANRDNGSPLLADVDVDAQPSSHHQAPMPVPARTQSDSLWQRRLQTRNKEIHDMRMRMSAPEIPTLVGMQSQFQSDQQSGALAAALSDNAMSRSFNSGDYGQSMMHDGAGAAVSASVAAAAATAAATAQFSTFAPNNVDDALSYPSYGLPFTQEQHNAHVQAAINNALGTYSIPSYTEHQDPNAMKNNDGGLSPHQSPYGLKHTSDGIKQKRVRTSSSHETLSESAQHIVDDQAIASKGVINKVIVPPAPGGASDAVDMRTGETGQMRHMCPFPGCDKHFSTSGHARRHSRIHDCLRPFECPHENCHATFTRRDNCTQHQRARHRYQLTAHRLGADQGEL